MQAQSQDIDQKLQVSQDDKVIEIKTLPYHDQIPVTAVKGANNRAVGEDLAAFLPQSPKPWYLTPHLLKLNLMLFCTMLFSGTVGYDNSMMNGLQALPQWDTFMHKPRGAYLGFVNAIQALGSCVGYPCMAWIANRWGRKKSIYLGCVVLAVGVIMQTSANSRGVFIASRFFVGAASGFFGAVPVLVTETAYPTHRGKITASYNTLYYFGSLLAAWVTFGTRNYANSWAWRIPSLLQVAIPAVALCGTVFCPESPRWLIDAGRKDEARAILTKYHAGGDVSSPLVAFEMSEISQTLASESSANGSASYHEMVRTRGNRHRLFISVSVGVFAQWCGVGIVAYYLAPVLKTVGVTSVTQQTLISGFLQLFNLITALSAAFLVDRLGRRVLFLTSCFGMLVCYIIITGLSGSFAITEHAATGIAVVPMLFIYYAFHNLAIMPLVVAYPAEIWPYHLRSRGIAVVAMSTFSALFFNLFVNSIALTTIGWKYYIIFIVILIVMCYTCWRFYPETRGKSLEEIAIVFDGIEALVAQRHDKLEINHEGKKTSSKTGNVSVSDLN